MKIYIVTKCTDVNQNVFVTSSKKLASFLSETLSIDTGQTYYVETHDLIGVEMLEHN